jgi:predicted extracellular nuclease
MKNLTFILFITLCAFSYSQKLAIGFYNVENLFDTIDDPNKNDAEFLPSGKNQWNSIRYNEKLMHINKVLDQMEPLLAVGFCEVENQFVLQEIINNSISRKNFKIVHHDSPDDRGIDVGMIYNPEKLVLLNSGKIRFIIPGKEKPSTRDIVWGKFLAKKDTLFIMVNHWPSRIGGEEKTNPNRLEAAKNARFFIDSIQAISSLTKIVLMGDLNDHITNDAPKLIAEKLTPMIHKNSGEYGGTHFYNKEWDVLDHIFVSPNMIGKKKFKTLLNSGEILSPPFLIEEFKGNKQPFRTYASSKYLGGYSDHLPVKIIIKY